LLNRNFEVIGTVIWPRKGASQLSFLGHSLWMATGKGKLIRVLRPPRTKPLGKFLIAPGQENTQTLVLCTIPLLIYFGACSKSRNSSSFLVPVTLSPFSRHRSLSSFSVEGNKKESASGFSCSGSFGGAFAFMFRFEIWPISISFTSSDSFKTESNGTSKLRGGS